jgi:uncharacterized membrane protein YqjE
MGGLLNVRAPGPFFLDNLRGAGATLLEIASVRAALFGVELREEIERRKRSLALTACAGVLLHLVLVLVTFLVAAIFWDTHRVAAIAVMAGSYLVAAAAILLVLRVESSVKPPAFESTLAELAHDLRDLRAPR